MYKITIINNGPSNTPLASYCVRAYGFYEALRIAEQISGKANPIKIVGI